MLELFVVGSFWFWALIAAELVLLFVFTEYENGIGATLSVLAFGAALQFCGNINVFKLITENWFYLVPFLLSFVPFGCATAIFMWRKLVKNRLKEHNELFYEFLHEKGLPPETTVLPVQHRAEWIKRIERTKNYTTGQTVADTPLVRQHKAKIVRWISLWPFVMGLYLFKDMLREFATWLYSLLANFLQRIADNIYAGANVKQNLTLPPEEKVEQQQ